MSNLTKFELVPFVPSDYDFIYYVKKIVYQKYVEQNFGKWDDEYQYKFMDQFVLKSAKNIFLIKINNKKIGFVNGTNLTDGSYMQGNICILPEWQGKGIGTSILQKIIKEHNNQIIKLKVFKQNPAKKLYERFGFKIVGKTHSHFLMERKDKNFLK